MISYISKTNMFSFCYSS